MIRVEALLCNLQSYFLLTAFECRRTILRDFFKSPSDRTRLITAEGDGTGGGGISLTQLPDAALTPGAECGNCCEDDALDELDKESLPIGAPSVEKELALLTHWLTALSGSQSTSSQSSTIHVKIQKRSVALVPGCNATSAMLLSRARYSPSERIRQF